MYTHLNEVLKTQNEKSFRAIHSRACDAVEKLKSCEAELIRCLQEVDRLLVHRFLGYNSLFQYALHALKLSESQSYAYITVARKARELPQLQEAISTGELTVSKAVRITSVISEENQQKWIGLALELPKRDLEREVARANPRAARPEQARFLDAHTLELNTPLSEAGYKKLERVRELMAYGAGEWISLEKTIEALAEFYLERKDPVLCADRVQRRRAKKASGLDPSHDARVVPETAGPCRSAKNGNAAAEVREHSEEPSETLTPADKKLARAMKNKTAHLHPRSSSKRRPLPAAVQHQVRARDRGVCQAKLPNGSVCGSRMWLELHHITPSSLGGTDTVDNLLTVCRAHHQAWHR
ncbi:MAG: HNH endonuclease [Bdellovibrionaceae bacterium]|nr:HNH endonuclease [Pseudobdellovibrionaceae bacterium]